MGSAAQKMKTQVNEYQWRALWGRIWKPSHKLSSAHQQIRQLTKPAVHMRALPRTSPVWKSNGISNQKRSPNLTGRHLPLEWSHTTRTRRGVRGRNIFQQCCLSLASRGQQIPWFHMLSIEHTVFKSCIPGAWNNTSYLPVFVSWPWFYFSKSRYANRLN